MNFDQAFDRPISNEERIASKTQIVITHTLHVNTLTTWLFERLVLNPAS